MNLLFKNMVSESLCTHIGHSLRFWKCNPAIHQSGVDEAESGPQRPPGSRDGVQGQRGRGGRRGGGGRGLSARDMNQRDSNHNVQVVDKLNPYKIDRR